MSDCRLVGKSDTFVCFNTLSVVCSASSHTFKEHKSAPLVKKGGEGEVGRTLPYPQQRICNSAARSPNYSEALLKSETKPGQREREAELIQEIFSL